MAYVVLSRKYRPKTFSEIIGQSHITTTLERAISSGRIAQAYIFSGTRGTGKTTVARIFAKALNCVNGPTPTPCNQCAVCAAVDTGEDVDVIEIDGASHNSVEDIRELRSNAGYTPARSRYKIYYIDEVHMLSPGAFNALLKTLEEPPAHVKFILATTEPHKIPLTVQSRCQRFDFRNIPAEGILTRLKDICGWEQIDAEEGALALVARLARGSMRDAESLLEQVISFKDGAIALADVEEVLGVVSTETFSRILSALAAGDAAGALEGVETALSGGTSSRQFVSEFIDYLRDVLVAKVCTTESKLLVRSVAEKEMLANDADKLNQNALLYSMQLLSETYARMARSPQSRGLLDIAVIRLAQVDDFLALKEFISEMRDEGGGPAPRTASNDRLPFETVEDAAGPKLDGLAPGTWGQMVSEVKTKGAVAGAVLEKCGVRLDGDRLKVVVPAAHAFHKDMLEKPEVRETLEAAAFTALGHSVLVDVSVESNAASAAPGTASASSRKRELEAKVLENPSVRKVMEAFDGTLVDVEE